jgi:hypothetical protein
LRRNQKAGFAIDDNLGNAGEAGGHDGPRRRHRLKQYRWQGVDVAVARDDAG